MEPGAMIRGDKGASYNRGLKKNGNLIIRDAAAAIRIGGAGVAPGDAFNNIADMWVVKDLGFMPATGTAYKSKIGVLFSRHTNGPDRGIILDGVSGTGLRSVFELTPAPVGTMISLACLVIERSNLTGNRYGVYAPPGARVYCLRAVGNQAEQNNNGAGADGYDGGFLHGDIQGAVSIMDNMLEGQPDAVDLNSTGAAIRARFGYNYLESNHVNFSQFVLDRKSTRLNSSH